VTDVPDSTRDTVTGDRLGEVVAEYLATAEGGEPVNREAFLARHPEFAAELHELFDQHDRFLNVVEPYRAQPRAEVAVAVLKEGAPEEPTSIDVQARQVRGIGARHLDVATTARDVEPPADHDEDDRLARGSSGRPFGDYELQKVLGRSGMGVVYQARQKSLDRLVALKMIRTGLWATPQDVQRFHNEAQTVAILDYPGIVAIHEVGQIQGQHYFTMNLVEGTSLGNVLNEFESDPRKAAGLAVGIARAVHHAHQRGVLHRDLKPSNILIDSVGRPHVTDFGLAKRLESDAEQSISGSVVGTPSYMSPEQAGGHRASITVATDVYGLGAILYATLTGRPPFQGDSVVETLEMVQGSRPERPSLINPRVDRDLDTICLKCLDKDSRNRYGSAAALASDLERWLRGEPILARPVGSLERARKWARRRPAATALIAMSAIAGLTLVGLSMALIIHSRLRSAYAEVERQRGIAEGALESERTFLYTNRVLFAQRELAEYNPRRAEELLEECPADRRAWEWHYLKRQCNTELLTLTGHEGAINRIVFSPDGRRIASGGVDRTLRIWDSATGNPVTIWGGHSSAVGSVAISPDGRRVASCSGAPSEPGPFLIRDIVSGKSLLSIDVAAGGYPSVAFNADGRLLVIASGDIQGRDGSVWVLDSLTGKQLQRIPVLAQPAYFASFSPDGKSVMATVGGATAFESGDRTNAVVVWNVETGRQRFCLKAQRAPIISTTFSPDGRTIAAAGYDAIVRLYDAGEGRLREELAGHQSCVNHIAFSPDGRRIASASDDNRVIVWDAITGKYQFSFSGHRGGAFGLAFHPEGKRLATCGYDGQIKVWDATGPKDSKSLSTPARTGRVHSLAFNHQATLLAAACADHSVLLWEIPEGRLKATLTGHHKAVWGVAFSPDGRYIASSAGDWRRPELAGEVHLWDAATHRLIVALQAHRGIARTVAFSPDGSLLASGGGETHALDDHVILFDVASARRLRAIPCPDGAAASVAFSPDGREIAAASGNLARTWDVESGRPLVTFAGHRDQVYRVVYSTSGSRLASTGSDLTIRLWNAATGAELTRAPAHSFVSNSLFFSPDGRRIASVGGDNLLKIWDADDLQELLSLRGHESYVWAVAFSPDGRWVATADDFGLIKLWDGGPLRLSGR
jgi:WD40 repeat protein